ncbi:MAG: penicillin acylase family protein [Vicinamibacterales bacterium]
MAGWQRLLGALCAPRTAIRIHNGYKIRVGGRIAVQSQAVLAGALAAAATLLWSSAPLHGQRAAADRVEIRRDTFGVPHILAEDEEAAGFAFGYAMAEDHAAEIGRRYLQARGEAARHFGAGDVEADLAMRRLDNRAAARRALAEQTGRRFRRWLQGFADGINRYVTTHREQLPPWMPTVEPSDPLAYSRMFGILAALRPPSRLVEKYPTASPLEVLPEAIDPEVQGTGDEPGSNAVALAGTKTTSGRPILLGNPHLGWSSLYWEAHVTVRDRLNFYGSTLVGIPVLRAGFNDRLGYVQTNNGPDLQDIYALPLATGRTDAFVHNGRARPIERRRVAVEVKQADGSLVAEEREYEETTLGPVIYRTEDRVFVVRSVNVEWLRQYEGFFELMHAESLYAFRNILGRGLGVTSNYTYADIDGNILYVWNARLPRRPDASIDYSLDVPGDTGRLFWKGVHRLRDLPSLLNPAGGYVQNANNPPWWTSLRDAIDPSRYPPYIEQGELSLRAQVVLEAVDAAPRLSPDDVKRLKFSSRMRVADLLLPDVVKAAESVASPSEALRAGADALAAWDREAAARSRGAVLFDRFLTLYEDAAPEPFAIPWDPAAPMTTPRGLASPAAALAALERAVDEVRRQYGDERVAWGDVHRFRFGDLDLPGDGAAGRRGVFRVVTFNVAADGTHIAGHTAPDQPLAGFGDAWVLLVHFTRPVVTAWSVLAYGQTTDLASPHSRDQIALFANHQLRPVWFTEEAIAANLERRYRPGAATP